MKLCSSLRDKQINTYDMVRSALYNRDIHKVFEHLTFCLGEQGPLHRGGNWWEKEREHHKCCWESHTNHSAENILSFNCHNALWSRYYHTYFISDSQDLTNIRSQSWWGRNLDSQVHLSLRRLGPLHTHLTGGGKASWSFCTTRI